MKIIAETASNHMGELEYLKELSLACKNAGADFVTVQVFDLNAFVSPADKTSYSNFLKVKIQPYKWLEYFQWCEANSIDVLPCVLDKPSAEMCLEYGFKTVKIHASDIVNLDFLMLINQSFDKVFLEFGGANLVEISAALDLLKETEVVLLYGFNAYPTRIENQNLNFLETLEYLFNCKTGFADHSVNNEFIPLLAMAKGADYLEKHVTLESKNESRFDWQVSIEPEELKGMVERIKYFQPAFGNRLRLVSESEKNFRRLVYKKIITNRRIDAGEILTIKDIDYKRSVDGIESSEASVVLGKKMKVSIEENVIIKKEYLLD